MSCLPPNPAGQDGADLIESSCVFLTPLSEQDAVKAAKSRLRAHCLSDDLRSLITSKPKSTCLHDAKSKLCGWEF
eukprot:scaffold71876_cov43-Prasinocladus_malaysianus.AAC.2